MLVKRAQDWDESEMRWNNKLATGDEENDEETDPRTDSETLDKLLELSLPLSAPDDCGALDKWTRLAVREELPEPRVDEDIVLAPEYDAKKAEEEEKKNQVDSANFSGGGARFSCPTSRGARS